jgi:hypothetical protein
VGGAVREAFVSRLDDFNSVPAKTAGVRRLALDDFDPARVEAGSIMDANETYDLGSLLEALATFVRRFVVMNENQAAAVALWIAHTHAFDAADTTPYVHITSPS